MMMFYILMILILMNFMLKWNNMITILLSLEIVILWISLQFFYTIFNMNIFVFVLFIGVIEAILGLSLLIYYSRFFGTDNMSNFSF